MKLSKYLADYIEHEQELTKEAREYGALDYESIIQEGIEAFASTENVTIDVTIKPPRTTLKSQVREHFE